MKILIIHNHYLEEGGEDRVVDSEIKMLKGFGHEVIIYKRSNKEIKGFPLCKKVKFLLKDIIWSNETYREIREIIKKEKPDVAHVHNICILITPSVYDALDDFNIPVVQTLHNYRLICLNGLLYRDNKICEECLLRRSFLPALMHKCWRNSFFLSLAMARMLGAYFKKVNSQNKVAAYIALSKFSKNKFIESGLRQGKIFVKQNFI